MAPLQLFHCHTLFSSIIHPQINFEHTLIGSRMYKDQSWHVLWIFLSILWRLKSKCLCMFALTEFAILMQRIYGKLINLSFRCSLEFINLKCNKQQEEYMTSIWNQMPQQTSLARETAINSLNQISSSFINPIPLLECLCTAGNCCTRIHTLSKLQVLLTK